eukprot:scpid92439/ scgid12233/ 
MTGLFVLIVILASSMSSIAMSGDKQGVTPINAPCHFDDEDCHRGKGSGRAIPQDIDSSSIVGGSGEESPEVAQYSILPTEANVIPGIRLSSRSHPSHLPTTLASKVESRQTRLIFEWLEAGVLVLILIEAIGIIALQIAISRKLGQSAVAVNSRNMAV